MNSKFRIATIKKQTPVMELQSPQVTVAKSAQYVFDQLSDVKNFEKLMPENIAKFEVMADDVFIFGLKGMPEIKLKIKEKQSPGKLVLGAAGDKLPFTLTAKIDPVEAEESNVQLFFEGEFNAMMAMMAKGPISKFIETLAGNMGKL
jgi:carbon monoxide dehydrogenase subunit G